ncbi:low choriolytic enzyme [Polymixia lowei]
MLQLLLIAQILVECVRDVRCGPIPGGDRVLSEDCPASTLQNKQSDPETLEELTNLDYAFVQGDMLVPDDRNVVGSVWPEFDGQISLAYLISTDVADRTDDILSALVMLSEHTCVSFHNRTTELDYLFFKNGKGCASYIGYIGGQQPVFVGPPCKAGNICHEVLHALGFHHEHTRKDRVKYIKIVQHNIMEGMENNFNMQDGDTFDLPYDVNSILHYGSVFFSRNGLPTIISQKTEEGMGQRIYMTETDIQKVRRLYNCDAKEGKAAKEKETQHVGNEDEATRLTRQKIWESTHNSSRIPSKRVTGAPAIQTDGQSSVTSLMPVRD